MKYLKWISIYIVSHVIVYAWFAFIVCDANPLTWSNGGRIGYAYFSLVITVFAVIGFIFTKEDENPNRNNRARTT